MRKLLYALVAVVLVLAVATPVNASTDPTVRVAGGLIRGTDMGGYRSFAGVPYAAPPVGPLRWRAPQPVASWRGVRPSSEAPECAQNTPGINGQPSGVEDCLYLNVSAPPASHRHRPVLVFLHGGGFQNGSSSQYDAGRLAAHGDLVVVTVNYRLGVFGYYGLPGLAGSGTFGLQDQQAALRWVRRNAAAFGGDPRNVTLDGQSAGGMSVCAQMTSPSAAGLFDKAIIQSGSCFVDWPTDLFTPGIPAGSQFSDVDRVDATGSALAAALGCRTIACMRAQDKTTLLGKTTGTGVEAFITPAYGSALLPVHPADAIRAGRFARVPVLSGSNLDEHRGFLAFSGKPITDLMYASALRAAFGDRADEVAARYSVATYGTALLAWSAAATDRIWACPTATGDRLLARHTPTFAYEFAEPTEWPGGAVHGAELPGLFDVSALPFPIKPDLGDRMIAAWSRFARTGNPGGQWPRFPHVEVLASGRSGPVDLAAEHQCDFWDAIPNAGNQRK